MKIEEALGISLKNIRKGKKISQATLARESNLERTYISMLERGIKSPTISTVYKIGLVLDIKPSKLLEIAEDLVLKKG